MNNLETPSFNPSSSFNHIAEFDRGTRGSNYRLANDKMPHVRQCEFLHMYNKIDPQPGQTIMECGTGNGFLTIPLAQAVGPLGCVYTLDDSASNLQSVKEKADSMGLKNIQYILLDEKYFKTGTFPLMNIKMDTIASIATFHHYDDMKQAALNEFKRLLHEDGKIIIADVAHGTKPQSYFDDFVHAICSTGHDHRFLDERSLEKLGENAGLVLREWQHAYVPWQFDNHNEMGHFLHVIHDATCSLEHSIEGAEKLLGTTMFADRVFLYWDLFYATLRAK